MARIYPLFSSSKGNSSFIGNSDGGILVDAGVSCKRLCEALKANDIDPAVIQGIFITHTHSDHVSGLKVLTKKYHIPVFAQKTNLEILVSDGKIDPACDVNEVDDNEVCIGDYAVKGFATFHDTPASCGYQIKTPDGKQVCVCTDLGTVTNEVDMHLSGSDLVLLESNYDESMLKNGPYPYELKRRIASDHGHLSNSACGEQLKKLMTAGTYKFILGHLSQENNTPFQAENSAVGALGDYERNSDYILHIAKPEGSGMAVAF